MKRKGFIRALWGHYDDQGRRLYKRRAKIDNDISLGLKNKFRLPFKAYVFGEENHKYLKGLGIDSKLIAKEPIIWDMDTEQYRHKLEVLKIGF